MIYFENGKFCAHGAYFGVPDGFYLETQPGDEAMECGICLHAPDGTYMVKLYWETVPEGARQELELLSEEGCELLSPAAPLTVNALSGIHVAYRSGGYGYYEARFDLGPDGEGTVNLVVLLCTRKDHIRRSVHSGAFQRLMNSLGKTL